MMANERNEIKSGYRIPKKRANIRLSGDELFPTCYQSGSLELRSIELLRIQEARIAELEQRLLMLERWAQRMTAVEKEGTQSEESLVLRVDKTTAGYILGVTRSTVYAMIADGRVQASSDGKRVSVRSIARYLQ